MRPCRVDVLRRGVLLIALATVLFAAITLVALEGVEVVVVRTVDARGVARETRTWIADYDGAMWLEAASPERPFLQHVNANPQLQLSRGGRTLNCRGVVVPNPEGHLRIRALLAERYGWADWWIGRLTDTSVSVALRLTCE